MSNEQYNPNNPRLEVHKKDDDKNFQGLYKLVWIGVGILGAVQFIVFAVKK